jgi:hypothetical protein
MHENKSRENINKRRESWSKSFQIVHEPLRLAALSRVSFEKDPKRRRKEVRPRFPLFPRVYQGKQKEYLYTPRASLRE